MKVKIAVFQDSNGQNHVKAFDVTDSDEFIEEWVQTWFQAYDDEGDDENVEVTTLDTDDSYPDRIL